MSEGARRCILLYRESVDDARTFLSAARTRPVILIKGGQGASRAEAACSSTGALAADALERAGGELAALPPATLAAIDKMESPNGSHRNPTLGRDPLPKTAPSSSR